MSRQIFLLLICAIFFGAELRAQIGRVETGIASFYHDKFVGRKTANGEIYSQEKMTAAHKTLPLGTWVKVTNLSNDSTIVVRINDRMPQSNKRSIDLTEMAAAKLNFIPKGLTKVRIEVIPAPDAVPVRPVLPEAHIVPIKPGIFEIAHEHAGIMQSTVSPELLLTEDTGEKSRRKRKL